MTRFVFCPWKFHRNPYQKATVSGAAVKEEKVAVLEKAELDPYDYIYLAC